MGAGCDILALLEDDDQREDIRRTASKRSRQGLMEDENHAAFLKKLSSKFDISILRSEPAGTGIYVFVDAEDNPEFRNKFNRAPLWTADELGYICVRQGKTDDIANVGEKAAMWLFVRDDNSEKEKTIESLRQVEAAIRDYISAT